MKIATYVSSFDDKFNKFKQEVEKLKTLRKSTVNKLKAGKREGEVIEDGVLTWLTKVDKVLPEAYKLCEEAREANAVCSPWPFPNLKSRFQLSRKARKLEADLHELSSVRFNQLTKKHSSKELESRKLMEAEIIEALRDPNVTRIGIHGVAGVGKTVVAKQVARLVKGNMFDVVYMTTVSKTLDVDKIWSEIKDQLSEETSTVNERIKKEKSILFVLDDVWEKIDLESLVIYLAQGCKFLLVSRDQQILQKNKTQQNFELELLTDHDSLALFQTRVGDVPEDVNLRVKARKLVRICGGLPIAIVTLAASLQGKAVSYWEEALRILNQNEYDDQQPIYTIVELSYDQLEDEEVKKVFLLCGVHGPSIFVNDLLKYAIGLGIFKHEHSIDDARSRLQRIIADLEEKHSLLLHYSAREVKVHDLICDVASSIASKRRKVFTSNALLKEWPGGDFLASCTQIILKRCNIQNLPEKLDCPNLYLLYLENDQTLEIPHSFFKGMRNLQVLVLIGMTIYSMPASLVSLAKLKTLCFSQCFLQDLVGMGALKSLEILSFFQSSIKESLNEIEQLTHLRMLDLSSSNIEDFSPKIMFNLVPKLEELYMDIMQKEHDILAEFMNLESLTALELQIPEASILQCGIMFDSNGTSRLFKLNLDPKIHLEEEVIAIIKRVEDLSLKEINGFLDVLYELRNEGFPRLKKLHIRNNTKIQHIVYSSERNEALVSFPNLETMILDNLINLENICPEHMIIDSFQNLKVIKVASCGRLEYLFSVSNTKFSKLDEIEVSECRSMKNIMHLDGGTTVDKIESIAVRSLTLQHLPEINGFFGNDSESFDIPTLFPDEKALFHALNHLKLINVSRIELLVITPLLNGLIPLENLETLEIVDCDDLQYLFVVKGLNTHENNGGLLPDLHELRLRNLIKLRNIVGLNHPGGTLSFKMLKHLIVCSCNELKCVLPLYVIRNLQLLQNIEVRDCVMLVRIFGDEEDIQMTESNETATKNTLELPQVNSLILEELPEFSGCCQDGSTVEWLSLKRVRVVKCPMIQRSSLGIIDRPLLTSLEVIECNSWAKKETPESNIVYLFKLTDVLSRLEELKIEDSKELKKYMEMELQKSSFTQLKILEVRQCDRELIKFLSILLRQSHELKELKVENCQQLKEVFNLTEFVDKEHKNMKFSNLNNMQLLCLPNLTCIWNERDPTAFVELRKLVKLEIIKCGLHKSPLSTVLVEKLVHLEEMKIESCEMIEQIVEDDTEIKERSFNMTFRNLKDLQLGRLPKLIKFNSVNCNMKFPNLQRLRIEKCPELNAFTTGFLSKTTNEGTSHHVSPDEKMDACPKLQRLKLIGHENFDEIWPGRVCNMLDLRIKEIEVDSFSKLRYIFPSTMLPLLLKKLETLVVRNCNSLSNVFQLRDNDSIMTFQNLKILRVKGCNSLQHLLLPFRYPSLTELNISDCQSLEQIFIDTKIKVDEKCFPNLEDIVLENLQMLSNFPLETFEFPKLERVRIISCPAFKTFSAKANNFMDTDSSESPPFGHGKTVLLPQLQLLELSDLPNMQLWNQEPQVPVFENLTSLKIICCGSIVKLFSISVAQHLSSLKFLTLYNCEHIVQVLQGGGGNSKRVFQNLETLVLKHLPRLTSFCDEDVDFGEFPKLKMVRVEDVPNMNTFVKKPLNTPELKQVHVTYITKLWQGDLNKTIPYVQEKHGTLKDKIWESDWSSTRHHMDTSESSFQRCIRSEM